MEHRGAGSRTAGEPAEPIWPYLLIGGAATVVNLFLAFALMLKIGLGTCGGDGGTPYADPGSPADHFCNGQGFLGATHSWLIVAGFLASIVGAFLGALRQSLRVALLSAIGGFVTLLVIFIVVPNT